eukprot:10286161-Prorocentrum_lima.AAC.1
MADADAYYSWKWTRDARMGAPSKHGNGSPGRAHERIEDVRDRGTWQPEVSDHVAQPAQIPLQTAIEKTEGLETETYDAR